MGNQIEKIEFRKEDFENNQFLSVTDCPLARAVKRHFNTNDVLVGFNDLNVDSIKHKIDTKTWNCRICYQIQKEFLNETISEFNIEIVK